MNLQPMTRLFKSSSWMLHSGVEERSLSAEHSELVWYAGGAYGATIRLNSFSYFWLTGAVELQTAPRLDSALTAGAGPRGGFVLHTGSFGSLVAEGKYLWYLGDSEHTEGEVSVKYSLYPAINHSLTAEAKYMTQYGRDATEYGLSYRFFF